MPRCSANGRSDGTYVVWMHFTSTDPDKLIGDVAVLAFGQNILPFYCLVCGGAKSAIGVSAMLQTWTRFCTPFSHAQCQHGLPRSPEGQQYLCRQQAICKLQLWPLQHMRLEHPPPRHMTCCLLKYTDDLAEGEPRLRQHFLHAPARNISEAATARGGDRDGGVGGKARPSTKKNPLRTYFASSCLLVINLARLGDA